MILQIFNSSRILQESLRNCWSSLSLLFFFLLFVFLSLKIPFSILGMASDVEKYEILKISQIWPFILIQGLKIALGCQSAWGKALAWGFVALVCSKVARGYAMSDDHETKFDLGLHSYAPRLLSLDGFLLLLPLLLSFSLFSYQILHKFILWSKNS